MALIAVALMIFAPMTAAAEPLPAELTEEPALPVEAAPTTPAEESPAGPTEPAAEPSPAEPTADPTPAAADRSEEPEPEQAVIQARVAGKGVLELAEADGDAIELQADGTFSVDQGSTVQVEALPEAGSEYVMTKYNGRSVDAARAPSRRRVSFVATESGELEVTFAPRHEVTLELSGNAVVSVTADGKERTLSPGESFTVSDGSAVQFRVTPLQGSDFDGADFNGRAIPASKEGDGWVFSVPVRENGVISVRTTLFCTVSTILQNVELRYDNGGTWQTVKEGDNVLALPGGETATFLVSPKAGCELTTLLVNGAGIDARRNGDSYRFNIRDVHGPVVLTAVAEQRTHAVQGVDSKTGVHYRLPGSSEADASNITEDSWIKVVELTSGPAYDQALADARRYGELLSAYDLSLHNADGRYEPSVPVYVSFPVPSSYAGGQLKVLHASGTSIQEIPYRSEEINGVPCVTVAVADFSLYMLVDAQNDAPVAAGEVNGGSSGGTGSLVVFLVLLGLSGLALLLTFRQRRTAH